jgi:hypothetical protein
MEAGQAYIPIDGPSDADYSVQLSASRDLMFGLREVVRLACEQVGTEDALSDREFADRHVGGVDAVPELTRSKVQDLFESFERETKAALSLALDALAPNLDEQAVKHEPFRFLLGLVDHKAALSQLSSAAMGLADDRGAAEYLRAYIDAQNRMPKLPTVLRSVLITAFSALETAAGRVVRRMLLDRGDFTSYVDPALDSEVARLVGQGGPEKWRINLHATFGIDLAQLVTDWPAVIEFWARRNLFAHHRGIVDERYRSRVPDAPAVGTPIEVTAGNVCDAVDLAHTVAANLVVTAWAAANPAAAQAALTVVEVWALDALDAGRWRQTEEFAWLALRSTASGSEATARWNHQVNLWLARSGRLGSQAVRDDVAAWDPSELDELFVVARHILLEEDAAALDLIARLRAAGNLDDTTLGWPLFARLRAAGQLRATP